MLTIPPPASNAERQRKFRARNPGYFKRYRQSARQLQAQARARAAREAALAKQQHSAFPETLFDLLPNPIPAAA